MHQLALNGAWQFRQAGESEWLPAEVPGGVFTDLIAARRLPDPFVSDNEKQVQWVAHKDWEYRRTFKAPDDLLSEERIYLVCEGLDTIASLSLNGKPVGEAENMFRTYRWEVKNLLQPGQNQLEVNFQGPLAYIAGREQYRHIPVSGGNLPGGPHMRKAPCHFGWDWGPSLPAIGIWRDIYLEGRSAARFEDVHIRQDHSAGKVTLSARAYLDIWDPASMQLELTVTAPDGKTWNASTAIRGVEQDVAVAIDHPQLWWPNGYGGHPLYQVETRLISGGKLQDRRSVTVGLRTLELRQREDDWGRSFTFVVNGVPVFCKGSNWIPADSFPTRVTPERLEYLIESAAAVNQNMLRVWGGGYYESDQFYELCDRYGILVWQDFMFACAIYPLDEEAFLQNVHAEVIDNVRRLRSHACLALWCGNNEVEEGWAYWGWNKPELANFKSAYGRFFNRILPEWVEDEDPDLSYWPSSPSSGTLFEDPNGQHQGDIHQWDVWHRMKPFTDYREQTPRFVSEFGFQSLPALATIATYADPSEWNMTSYIMEHHQRNAAGNGKIITYMTDHFQLPKDFPSLVYLTQVLQAEAMRMGVEHYRRNRVRTSGTLYWQLDDTWPVASWASIDYYGRWKALHYVARRFYAPLLLSIEDKQQHMGVYLTNDTAEPWQGQLRWSLETLSGSRLQHGQMEVGADPLETFPVRAFDFTGVVTDENRRSLVFVAELSQGNQLLATRVAGFVPDKHMKLEKPGIEVEVGESDGNLSIELRAASLARFVELSLEGADTRFSDNYFDIPAGRLVTVSCPIPEGWGFEQTRDALHVISLIDTYTTQVFKAVSISK